MTISLVTERILCSELKTIAAETYVTLIKAVADLDKGIVGFGGKLHKDVEALLLSEGSDTKNLWGFCLHFDRPVDDAFEFRSHINMRPQDGNPSIQINDAKICQAIRDLVALRVDWNG